MRRQCRTTSKPQCPHDCHVVNDQCVSITGPTCSDGGTYNATTGTCDQVVKSAVCPDGTVLQGGQCIHRKGPTCHKNDYAISINPNDGSARCCPTGMDWNGNACHARPLNGRCTNGAPPIKAYCYDYVVEPPRCEPGYKVNHNGVARLASSKLAINASHPNPLLAPQTAGWKETSALASIRRLAVANPLGTGHKCLTSHPLVCDEGVPHADGCTTNYRPQCPGNAIFNGRECVSVEPPECPSNAVLDDNGNCVTSKLPKCPPGAKFQNGKCVDGKPGCQNGFVYVNGQCQTLHKPQCDPGFKYVDGQCVRPGAEKECGEGYIYRDGQCHSSEKPGCPPGSTFNGYRCVVDARPRYPPGTHLEGEDCVGIPPQCQDGFTLYNNRCIAVKPPDCPDGARFGKFTGECVSIVTPECAEGQVFKDGKCMLASGRCFEYQYCPTENPFKGGGSQHIFKPGPGREHLEPSENEPAYKLP
ncbi:hypothetical protein BDW62DRAFT_196672 [Aspergillus aurantiobrunneus]